MDDKRMKCMLVRLKGDALTLGERQFTEAVEKHFHEKGALTDHQESILEGIYREKIWMRKAFFSRNNLFRDSSSKAA